MTFKNNFESEGYTCKVEAAREIGLESPRWGELSQILLHITLLLPAEVKYDPDGTYKLTLRDGREWRQTIMPEDTPTGDPPMTFDVTAPWRLSEFQHQRMLRDWIVACVMMYGLTKLKVTWPAAS